MSNLIPITYTNDRPTVSGRALHEALEVKTAYKDWFPRMVGYGFTEGADFNPLKNERVQMEGKREVTRIVEDHQLTINMAKELCMIQRTDKGKECRAYFLAVEKQWNSPEAVMARALQMANRQLDTIKDRVKLLEAMAEADRPKVLFADSVLRRVDSPLLCRSVFRRRVRGPALAGDLRTLRFARRSQKPQNALWRFSFLWE